MIYNYTELEKKKIIKTHSSNTINFTFIGMITKRKNILSMIKGIRLLYEANANVKLFIIGNNGNALKEIKDYITLHKLQNVVKILLNCSENQKKQILESTFCFLHPSHLEGFCYPVIEAMSYGLPIIYNDIDIFNEIIGGYGLKVKFNNSVNFRTKCEKIINNKTFRDDLISGSFERFYFFSKYKYRKKMINFYNG